MALPKTIMSATVGASLGPYKLQALLGEGGMGRVFKARDSKKRRTVAIKVLNSLHSSDADMVKRFMREARVITEIAHKNIVEVFDLISERGQVYCVMEYLEGQSLEKALAGKRGLKLSRTVEILTSVAEALEAAHARGVIHRDLKPDNIFLLDEPTDEGVSVKVLDFGIAKLLDPKATQVTAQGFILGTPSYMSIEQASGMEVDHRTDVYSFGVVAFRMLSGKLPHTFGSYGEMLAALNGKTPKLPGKTPRGEAIPTPLAKLTAACMSKDLPERPQSFEEVRSVLEKIGASLQPARRSRKKKRRRSRAGRWVALALLAAGVGAGVVYREPVTAFVEKHRLLQKLEALTVNWDRLN